MVVKNKENSVTSRIVNYIRSHIDDGSWPPGSKIPSEQELCQTLGVSRGSVRTALQRFIVLGVLESRQGRGTTVRTADTSAIGKGYVPGGRTTSNELVLQLGQARFTIEPMVAYQVAKNATPQLVERLEEINRQMFNSIGTPERFVHYDMLFHKTLVDALDNPMLSQFLYSLLDNYQEIHLQNNQSFGYYGGVHYHTLITDAIKNRNAVRALNLMLEHGTTNFGDFALECEITLDEGSES